MLAPRKKCLNAKRNAPLIDTRGIVRGVNELEQWNARYLAGERGETKPSPLVVQAAAELPAGRAFDLACGAGRNALFLAKNGWDVVAVDGSPEAIRITKQRAKRVGVKLETLVADLETSLPLPFEDASGDLVTIVLYLQPALLLEARRLLRPGGTCAVSVKTAGSFAMPLDALRELFAGWEVVVAREGDGVAEVIALSQS
jgi:SAM-dependent methyltransferase